LVQLRRLGKCVELAGVHPARHDVITRSLRGRLRQNRRLDLQVSALVEIPSRRLHQAMPQNQILLQIAAPEVEITMFEAQLFAGELLAFAARHRNGGSLSRADDLKILGADFDLARLHLGVSHFAWPRRDFALDHDHRLETKLAGAFDHFGRGPLRVERDLDKTRAITQVEKDDATEVPRAMDPAAQSDLAASV